MQPLLLITGLVILAVVAGRGAWLRRRESRHLRELADRRRLNFAPDDLIGVYERYVHLDLIHRGHNRHVWNVLYGTTDAGLVTLFCYAYELGFGTNRTQEQWWMGVLETGDLHDTWQALPEEAIKRNYTKVGEVCVRTDRRTTRRSLEASEEIRSILDPADRPCHWEVRGPLLAVAARLDSDPATAEQLLARLVRLARGLAAVETSPIEGDGGTEGERDRETERLRD